MDISRFIFCPMSSLSICTLVCIISATCGAYFTCFMRWPCKVSSKRFFVLPGALIFHVFTRKRYRMTRMNHMSCTHLDSVWFLFLHSVAPFLPFLSFADAPACQKAWWTLNTESFVRRVAFIQWRATLTPCWRYVRSRLYTYTPSDNEYC